MNIDKILKSRYELTATEANQYKSEIIKSFKDDRVLKKGGCYSFQTSTQTKTFDFDLKEGEIGVEVVANMANFMDFDSDVLTPDCWDKCLLERGNTIKFQHDHIHEVTATIGDTIKFESRQIDLKPYGYNTKGTALVHVAKVIMDYNKSVYEQYKRGQIQQHSVGMYYKDLAFAYAEGTEEEKEIYEKYKNNIINFAEVEKKGYFWLVKEVDIFENSAVLFGANKMTPTLAIQTNTNKGFNFFTNIVHSKWKN